MTHVVVSRLKNARLASEQHLCNVLLLFFETAAGQKSALWSLKVWHWGTKLGISIKSSDTSVPSGRRKKSYTHSNLTSGVNEVSAYFHYLGHRCLRHHALQLTAAMTTAQLSLFFFSTLPIHVINLIASHPNILSFSVPVMPYLPTSCTTWPFHLCSHLGLITLSGVCGAAAG